MNKNHPRYNRIYIIDGADDMSTYYITEMYPNGRISPPYAIDRDDINAASYYAEQNRLVNDSTLIVKTEDDTEWLILRAGKKVWQGRARCTA